MAKRQLGAGEVIIIAVTLAGGLLTLLALWEADQSASPPPPTTLQRFTRFRAPPIRPHAGLYPPPAPLLNLPAFSFVANSPACDSEPDQLLLVILVFSHPAHAALRDAHRAAASWEVLYGLGARRVFLLADGSGDAQNGYPRVPMAQVAEESGVFRDLVVADFRDHYRNLTYKHALALTWARSFCPQAKYILKMDDDMMVDLWGLTDMLRQGLVVDDKGVVTNGRSDDVEVAETKAKFGPWGVLKRAKEEVLSPKGLWAAGLVQRGLTPQRSHGKWRVSMEEYPRRLYPTFLSGWAYVTTQPAAEAILKAARERNHTQPFWIDDVYMTGMLATSAGVARHALSHHYSLVRGAATCCLEAPLRPGTQSNAGAPLCGLLVAPSDKNATLLVRWMEAARACHEGKECPSPLPHSCPPTRPHYAVGTVIPLT